MTGDCFLIPPINMVISGWFMVRFTALISRNFCRISTDGIGSYEVEPVSFLPVKWLFWKKTTCLTWKFGVKCSAFCSLWVGEESSPIWMRIFARITPFTDKGWNRLHPSEAKDSHGKNILAPQLPCCCGPIWSPFALILALKGHSCPKITQHFRFVAYALFQPDPISYHQPLSRTH